MSTVILICIVVMLAVLFLLYFTSSAVLDITVFPEAAFNTVTYDACSSYIISL